MKISPYLIIHLPACFALVGCEPYPKEPEIVNCWKVEVKVLLASQVGGCNAIGRVINETGSEMGWTIVSESGNRLLVSDFDYFSEGRLEPFREALVEITGKYVMDGDTKTMLLSRIDEISIIEE